MRQVFIGAALVIAGIAAFIEAGGRAPQYASKCLGHERGTAEAGQSLCEGEEVRYLVPEHLSRTPYDLLRIGAWALVLVGGVLMVMGLIRYWRAQPRQ
jgi:hypothetical protein